MTFIVQKPRHHYYPTKVKTIGDHLRKTRLDRDINQREIAKLLGADVKTVWDWEQNKSFPTVYYAKKVIDFLGYNPFPLKGIPLREKVFNARMLSGLEQEEVASKIGVKCATYRKIEVGKTTKPYQRTLDKIVPFIEEQYSIFDQTEVE